MTASLSLIGTLTLLSFFVFACVKQGDKVRIKNFALLFTVTLGLCLISRLLLPLLQPNLLHGLSPFQILFAFAFGLRFDLAVTALIAGPFLLLLNLPVGGIRWQKFILAAGMAAAGFLIVILAGDSVYFAYVQRHTGMDIWNLLTTFSLIWKITVRQYWGLLAATAVVTAGLMLWGWYFAACNGTPKRGHLIWNLLILVLLSWMLTASVRNEWFYLRPLSTHLAYERSLVQGHLIQNGAFSILYAIKPTIFYPAAKGKVPGYAAITRITATDALKLTRQLFSSPQEQTPDPDYPLMRVRTQFNADARGKNLIVIILESLEYHYIDFLAGTSYGATPNLDALMNQSLVFDNFYSAVDNNSLGGVGTILSGIPRISGRGYFREGLETTNISYLGHLFASAGYTTWFVRSANDNWMFIGPLARLAGFTTFASEDLTSKLSYPGAAPSDYEALQLLAEKLIASPKPFAAVFFSLATHDHAGNYVPQTFGGIEKKFPEDSYLRALAYTDWSIGQFIQTLKQNNLYENTVFVITADHRDRLSPHDTLKEGFHIPLAIYAPNVLPAKRIHIVAGQADLLPTLVDLFHIQAPYSALGNSLLDKHAPRFAFFSYMAGEHFGLTNQQGMVLEDENLFPEQQTPKGDQIRYCALALNRTAYDLLQSNHWFK